MSRLVTLSEICDFLSGYAWSSAGFSTSPCGLPIIRIQNVASLNPDKDFIYWTGNFDERFLISTGDILLSMSGSFRCCRWSGPQGLLNQRVVKIVPNLQFVDPDFLLHALGSKLLQIERMGRHALVNNVALSDLRGLRLVLPPLPEQKRIAAILDKADEIRRKREKAIELTDSFLRSVFLEMFGESAIDSAGWQVVQLGDLLSFLTSGSRGWARYYSEQGDIFLRIQNVANGRLKLDDLTYVNAPATAEGNRTKVREGDILLSITADLGRTAVIPPGFPTAYINQHLALLRVKGINPFFLSAFLSSPVGRRQIQRLNREGVKAGLNFEDIRSLRIPLPPQPLQQKYCDIWNKQTSLLERIKISSQILGSLSSSLSAQLFSPHPQQQDRFRFTTSSKEVAHAL
jgi:type I restriction enzyme S subunit